MGKIELHISIDADHIESVIRKSKDLQADELVFHELSWLMRNKYAVEELVEQWQSIEKNIKQAINDKAKDLLGPEWKALDGDGWKARRSLTGSVFQIQDPEKVPEELLEVKLSLKTKLVNDYIKAHSAVPEGLEYNPNRNESIGIKLT